MTQTKNKSRKSVKKQPVKVQLSKQDLIELLTVLKNFMREEMQEQFRPLNHRVGYLHERVVSLEGKERRRENKVLIKSRASCSHEDKLESISYGHLTGTFISANYKCKWCGLENRKSSWFLSRKEKKALNRLGVNIK